MKSVLVGMATLAMAPTPSLATITTPSGSAVNGSIARGAQRVPVLSITVEASCNTAPVRVTSLTVTHAGLGASTDIARVYVLLGFARITRSFPLPAHGEPLVLPLRNLTLSACESRNLTLAVDFSSDASIASEHVFSVTNVDAGKASVSYVSSKQDATLNVGASGTPAMVAAELLPVLTPVSYGSQRTIARLSLQGTGGKDQRVTAITLTNNGSASDDNLQNLAWFLRTGEKISDAIPQLQGRIARITFDPGLLLQGRDTKLIELRADVRASRKKTIRWSMEEPSDVEATVVRTR